MKVTPRKLGGIVELLPAEQIEFNRLLDIIRHTYEKYDFAPIDTPDLELTEVLLAKGGGETEQEVYSFTREGSKTNLTLRYDLTVPLARYVAEHESDLTFPFRRYHIGKVHRAERPQKGRFREFYQCDIDVIGSNSPIIDAEFPAVISEIFEQFNFGDFTIHINNRLILNGFFEGIGLKEVSRDVLRTIDKIEKLSHEDFVQQLQTIGLTDEQVAKVIDFTNIGGDNDMILDTLKHLDIPSTDYQNGVEKLSTLIQALRSMQVPEKRFVVDLRIARGLDYYTGTVYETTLNDYPELGSVCSGGRYDDLASHYTKTQLPGVGISIGLTRLFSKLREIPGVVTATTQSPASAIILPIDEAQNNYGLSIAATLRGAGIPVQFYSEVEAFKKKLRYADKMGYAHVLITGQNEQDANVVSVKNMTSGETQTVPIDELVSFLS